MGNVLQMYSDVKLAFWCNISSLHWIKTNMLVRNWRATHQHRVENKRPTPRKSMQITVRMLKMDFHTSSENLEQSLTVKQPVITSSVKAVILCGDARNAICR